MILLCFTFGFCLPTFVWTSKMQGLSILFTAYIPMPVTGWYMVSINNMCWVKECTQSTDFKKEKTITEEICVFVHYCCVIIYCDCITVVWLCTAILCVTVEKTDSGFESSCNIYWLCHFGQVNLHTSVSSSENGDNSDYLSFVRMKWIAWNVLRT